MDAKKKVRKKASQTLDHIEACLRVLCGLLFILGSPSLSVRLSVTCELRQAMPDLPVRQSFSESATSVR
jgi:hypothetical protein